LVIERAGDVLTFTLDNAEHGNEVTGPMFDAMLAELRTEASRPSARVLRVRARGKVFCTGRERAGRDVAAIHKESARLMELKRALRASPLISVAEVQGDAFGSASGWRSSVTSCTWLTTLPWDFPRCNSVSHQRP